MPPRGLVALSLIFDRAAILAGRQPGKRRPSFAEKGLKIAEKFGYQREKASR